MKFRITIILLLIFFNIVFVTLYFSATAEKYHEITLLDVGQGSGTLLQTKDGENILIDTGNETVAVQSLTRELGFFDRDLDMVFATHYDLDHVGLLPFYLDNYDVDTVVDTGVTNIGDSQRPLYDAIHAAIVEGSVNKKTIQTGDKIWVSDDVFIKVFFPGRFLDLNKLQSNSGSMVLQIHINGYKVLITGDLPAKFERVLVERYGEQLRSDILVAGHHGSKTSSDELFLETVDPEYFVISAGRDNGYGHPNEEVLERAEKLGLHILRTDELGSVEFVVDEGLVLGK